MDNLSDLLEKLRVFLSGEEIPSNDDQHPPDVGLVRTVLEALKNEGIVFITFHLRRRSNESF
jgi:hypothetical protein